MSYARHKGQKVINIFTIGFAKKSAREFFEKLKDARVRIVIDVRLNNVSQLAGFTKKDDLKYFLSEIGGIEYTHKRELAPTKDILNAYRKGELVWDEYVNRFRELMLRRRIDHMVTPKDLDGSCLLCSEASAERCHRRLVAEYLQECWSEVTVHHL